jgi:hypothetical protein
MCLMEVHVRYVCNMDSIKHIHIKHGPPLNTYISNMDSIKHIQCVFCCFFFIASSLCVLFPMFPAPLDCSLLIAPFNFL